MLIAGSILLILVLANQLKEKPLTGKLYRQPLALLFFTACALPFMPAFLPADWIMLSAVAALSFGVGLVQGRFSPLVRHDGEWYLSGSLLAASVWALSIPIRYGLDWIAGQYLSDRSSLNGPSSYIIYFIFIAGLLLGRYTMLLLRYPSLTGIVARNERKRKSVRAH